MTIATKAPYAENMSFDQPQYEKPGGVGVIISSVLFMMLCGLVGPLFVIIYFVMDEGTRQDVPWMLWTGLGITLLNLIIGLIIGISRARTRNRRARLAAMGVRGTAKVQNITETNLTVNGVKVLKLALSVSAPGVMPFEKTVSERVSAVHALTLSAGELVVLIDPQTHDFIIDWGASNPWHEQADRLADRGQDARTAERLAELDRLRQAGHITAEEYATQRERILSSL